MLNVIMLSVVAPQLKLDLIHSCLLEMNE